MGEPKRTVIIIEEEEERTVLGSMEETACDIGRGVAEGLSGLASDLCNFVRRDDDDD